jgi:hypothetical protein
MHGVTKGAGYALLVEGEGAATSRSRVSEALSVVALVAAAIALTLAGVSLNSAHTTSSGQATVAKTVAEVGCGRPGAS